MRRQVSPKCRGQIVEHSVVKATEKKNTKPELAKCCAKSVKRDVRMTAV